MKVLDTFAFAGPNRRSDLPVIEQRIELTASARARLADAALVSRARQSEMLAAVTGIPGPRPAGGPDGPEDPFGTLYARTALALQSAAGHIVGESGSVPDSRTGVCRVYFEYEEIETGLGAAELALALLAAAIEADGDPGRVADLRKRFRAFDAQARPLAMPADARAIFEAARHRDVPVFRMDREPYDPVEGDFRLRKNALLRLGHGCRQHTVDGTFCVDLSEPLYPLIRNRKALLQKLHALGVPLPCGRHAPRFCLSPGRAMRVARQRGFPATVVRPATRSDGRAVALDLHDAEAVYAAAEATLAWSDQVLVEPHVPGRTYRLVLAGGRLLAMLAESSPDDSGTRRHEPVERYHPSLARLAERIATALPAGLMVVTLVVPDVMENIDDSGGAVVDVDLAPQLDRLLGFDDPALHAAAHAFVDWMFPEPARARIPVAAITGTNGKTTTSRMVARILERAGRRTGLACSDGSYVRGRRVSQFEDGYLPGHLTILDNPGVDTAVLESTRGGAGSTGLGFDRCSVAACLNVTPDHLGDLVGIRTLEEMAGLKRWIVERAEYAVVLNADDERCMAMAPHLEGRAVGLTSLALPGDVLLARAGPGGCACVVESIEGIPWVMLYSAAGRQPVMETAAIPLTFGGLAMHNVSNALHAATVCHFMGVTATTIAGALAEMDDSFENIPGRLNFYRELPFDVIMDYAHNPDGVRHVCEFVGRLPVRGRRIVAMSCSAANSDDFIRETAATAAGHFDHYVCKNYGLLYDREPHESPRLLREGLLAGGVDPGAVTCIEDEFNAIETALTMGRPGDLVLILAGKRKQEIWNLITGFGKRWAGADYLRSKDSVGQRSPSS